MTDNKHTPGRWKVAVMSGLVIVHHGESHDGECAANYEKSQIIAEWHGHKVDKPHPHWEMNPEDVANARLIAAAPELLEALDNLRRMIGNRRDTYWWEEATVVLADDAIAKATEEA